MDRLLGIEWTKHGAVRMSVGTIQTDHVTSVVECLNNCALSQLLELCDSINFRSADKSCELVRHVAELTVNAADIVADADWQWWRMSFSVVLFRVNRSPVLCYCRVCGACPLLTSSRLVRQVAFYQFCVPYFVCQSVDGVVMVLVY